MVYRGFTFRKGEDVNIYPVDIHEDLKVSFEGVSGPEQRFTRLKNETGFSQQM